MTGRQPGIWETWTDALESGFVAFTFLLVLGAALWMMFR